MKLPVLPSGVFPSELSFELPSSPTPWDVHDLAERLKRAGDAARRLTLSERILRLSMWLEAWRAPDAPWRVQAVQRLSEERGHHPLSVARALEHLFAPYTLETLQRWVEQELSPPCVPTQSLRWTPPDLVAVFLSGNVPPPALQSLLPCLLVGAPVFVKASSEAPVFARLLYASLKQADPILSEIVAVETWSGPAIQTDALLRHADVVQVYGGAETIYALRQRASERVRLLEHGPRVSLTYLTREAVEHAAETALAARVVEDVVLYEQQGCLSPHWILLEESPQAPPAIFCERLQAALEALASRLPAAPLEEGIAAAQVQLKGVHAFLGTLYETSAGSLCLETEGELKLSCLGRLALVRPVRDEHEAVKLLSPWRGMLQGLALETSYARQSSLLDRFLPLGFSYVCPAGQLQEAPVQWPGDGRRFLAELVRWTVITQL